MPLIITSYIIGPLQNNTYLAADPNSKSAVIIDPGLGSEIIITDIKKNNLIVEMLLFTHAHFDHVAGAQQILNAIGNDLLIGLHKEDINLLNSGGGAIEFRIDFEVRIKPNFELIDNQILHVGNEILKVLHTPGHTPGHVTFYSESSTVAFCGDLIFYHGVGRTDLSYGSFRKLENSIRSRIFSLPPETQLLCGHGPVTSVKEELSNNPFVK